MVFGLALVMALVFGVATTALSATGGNFLLGKPNSAGATSSLTANIAKPALTLINTSTNVAATALNINVDAGNAPIKVNASAGKAVNLNADKLDGLDSTALGVTVKENHQPTEECDAVTSWNECAPVTVKVPVGKQYHVTVLSSFGTYINSNSTGWANLYYCVGINDGSNGRCANGRGANGISADYLTLAPGYGESAATTQSIGPLAAGTYTFSTRLNPSEPLVGVDLANTTVMVRDASVPGPPIE